MAAPITILLANTNWWPCSALLSISLKHAGISVAAVYPIHGHPLAKTSAVTKRFPYRATSPLKSLETAIDRCSPDLIVPCDDRAVTHLHQLHARRLAIGGLDNSAVRLIERSLGSPAAFPVVSSRAALMRTALNEDVLVPNTTNISSLEDISQTSTFQAFPWVMKLDGSWGGLGVKVVRNIQEAKTNFLQMIAPLGTLAMLKRLVVNRDPFWIETWLRRTRPGVTVQSFIEGSPANCAVFCWEGKVLAGIPVSVVASQGVSGPATMVQVVEGSEMLRAAQAVVGRLHLSGFCGFDFMIEGKTSLPYLIELNARSTMPCHLRLGAGRDLVGALCSKLSTQPLRDPDVSITSDLISYFPQAWLSNPKSAALKRGYHDVPWEEQALLQELMLLPWPDRSLLARVSDRLRNMTFENRVALTYDDQAGLTNTNSQSMKPRQFVDEQH